MTKLDLAIERVREKASAEFLVVPVAVDGKQKYCVVRRVCDELFDSLEEAKDRQEFELIEYFTSVIWNRDRRR